MSKKTKKDTKPPTLPPPAEWIRLTPAQQQELRDAVSADQWSAFCAAFARPVKR